MRATLSVLSFLLSISATLTLAGPIQSTGNGLSFLKRDISGGFFCCCSGGQPCVVNVDLNCDLTLASVCPSDASAVEGDTNAADTASDDPGEGGGTSGGDGADAEEPGKDID